MRHGDGNLEAKLAQQLANLEQEPSYGVFFDLKKVFNAMGQGEMPPDSGGIWRGANHGPTDPHLLVGCDHGLLLIWKLRGTILCWPRHDPGGTTICQTVQHLG